MTQVTAYISNDFDAFYNSTVYKTTVDIQSLTVAAQCAVPYEKLLAANKIDTYEIVLRDLKKQIMRVIEQEVDKAIFGALQKGLMFVQNPASTSWDTAPPAEILANIKAFAVKMKDKEDHWAKYAGVDLTDLFAGDVTLETADYMYPDNHNPAFGNSTVEPALTAVIPALKEYKTKCPGRDEGYTEGAVGCTKDGIQGKEHSLSHVIQHLNDRHRWPLDKIADWLDTLDVDLTFPIPEGEAA